MIRSDGVLIKLISLMQELEKMGGYDIAGRDNHYEIVWTYSNGDPHWYIAHDGRNWNMNDVVLPSGNRFETSKEALEHFRKVMIQVIAQDIEWQKESFKDRPARFYDIEEEAKMIGRNL